MSSCERIHDMFHVNLTNNMIHRPLVGCIILLVVCSLTSCLNVFSLYNRLKCTLWNRTYPNVPDVPGPEFRRLGPRGFGLYVPGGETLEQIEVHYRLNIPLDLSTLDADEENEKLTFGHFDLVDDRFYYNDYFLNMSNSDVLHLFVSYFFHDGSYWLCLQKLCSINMTYFPI